MKPRTFKVFWHTQPSPASPFYSGVRTVTINETVDGPDPAQVAEERARRELRQSTFRDCPSRVVIDSAEEV